MKSSALLLKIDHPPIKYCAAEHACRPCSKKKKLTVVTFLAFLFSLKYVQNYIGKYISVLLLSVLAWHRASITMSTGSGHCHSAHGGTACSRSEPCTWLPLSNYQPIQDLCHLCVGWKTTGNISSGKKWQGRSYPAGIFLRGRLGLRQRGCF